MIPTKDNQKIAKSATVWKTGHTTRSKNTPNYSDTAILNEGTLSHIAAELLLRVTSPPDDIRLKRELLEIINECSEADWDGYDAHPIDQVSVRYAVQFIGLLPNHISYPELLPEPSGNLAMTWKNKNYHFMLGIDSNGHISYGGTHSKGKIYGTSKIKHTDNAIDEELIEVLEMVDE